MTLAVMGVPHPHASQQLGWAWVTLPLPPHTSSPLSPSQNSLQAHRWLLTIVLLLTQVAVSAGCVSASSSFCLPSGLDCAEFVAKHLLLHSNLIGAFSLFYGRFTWMHPERVCFAMAIQSCENT